MNKLRVLDLFSGIGGFSLGLERTGGFETVAFCEIDKAARRVLAKHWPEVPCYDDICSLAGERLAADGIAVDVLCGGFPCQDISDAGHKAGLEGKRSGLWSEIARLVGELRPRFVVVENVAALLGRGMGRVLGDLAALGYDAEWHCIPAAAVGAPHRRDRVWILGYPNPAWQSQPEGMQPDQWRRLGDTSAAAHVAHSDTAKRGQKRGACDGLAFSDDSVSQWQEGPGGFAPSGAHVADTERWRSQGRNVECAGASAILAAAYGRHCGGSEFGAPWRIEPDVGRVAYGVPGGMDRLKQLGNAVVPQIPELIGRAILVSLAQERLAA